MTLKYLPKTIYNFAIENETPLPIILPDVMVRFNFQFLDEERKQALFDYYILDGETPEIVSDKFYSTMDYHWVIMYINNRFDYLNEWPIKDEAIRRYVQQKYGVENAEAIHHYEDPKGNICNELYYDYTNQYGVQPTGVLAEQPIWKQSYSYDTGAPIPLQNAPAFAITNHEYETRVNDDKRYIKLIKAQYIVQFYKNYLTALSTL